MAVVIATQETRPPKPWVIMESTTFSGRFFFFNQETQDSTWQLPCWKGKTTNEEPLKDFFDAERYPTADAEMDASFDSLRISSAASANSPASTPEAAACASITMPSHVLFSRAAASTTAASLPLRPEHLVVVSGLGKGGYGVVVEVENQAASISSPTGEFGRFAMKCVPKEKYSRPCDRRRLEREVSILSATDPSPFLHRSVLAFETDDHVFVVSDLLTGGDLFLRLDQLLDEGREGFPEVQARALLSEVAMGLTHLHTQGWLHLDVKVENVMLDGNGRVKLIDFGLAERVPESASGAVRRTGGSLIYVPPEVLLHKLVGRFTDWWAFGVLAHELMTGRSPWSTLSDESQVRKEIKTLDVAAPKGLSLEAGTFLRSLLHKDHRQRLGTHSDSEVFAEPYFHGMDLAALEKGETPPAFAPQRGSLVSPQHSEDILGLYESSVASERKTKAPPIRAPAVGTI